LFNPGLKPGATNISSLPGFRRNGSANLPGNRQVFHSYKISKLLTSEIVRGYLRRTHPRFLSFEEREGRIGGKLFNPGLKPGLQIFHPSGILKRKEATAPVGPAGSVYTRGYNHFIPARTSRRDGACPIFTP
jgi:hypothetical protein